MDQATLQVVRAVEAGATTIKGVIDATGLSRLKIERALNALEKQRLLVRDSQGFRAAGRTAPPPTRQCGSCNACCDILEVAGVDKPVNQLCKHWQTGTGCTIYERRPQMCRSFVCAWLQGHLDEDWFPAKSGIIVHFSQDAVNVTVDDHCPDRWREEPYFSKLAEWSLNGIKRIGNRGYATLVVSGADRFLLLGRTVVPEPTLFGTAFLPLTADTFRFWRAKSPEHLQRLHERIAEIERIRQEFGSCAVPSNEDDDPQAPYRPALLRLSRHA
jgi:Fe-S-cluster containining protein